jgi:hypothetical protein
MQLQHYKPRTLGHQYLFAAFFQHWCQLCFSYWLGSGPVGTTKCSSHTQLAQEHLDLPGAQDRLGVTVACSLPQSDRTLAQLESAGHQRHCWGDNRWDHRRRSTPWRSHHYNQRRPNRKCCHSRNLLPRLRAIQINRALDGIEKAKKVGRHIPKNDAKKTICKSGQEKMYTRSQMMQND